MLCEPQGHVIGRGHVLAKLSAGGPADILESGGGLVPEAAGVKSATEPVDVSTRRRGIMEHRVKSWPHLFEATLSGIKTHELRRASDRDYRIGDTLRLQEFDPATERYTGREMIVRITYITSAEFPCALSED